MTTFKDVTTGKYYYEPIKLILFGIMWRYLFQKKTYPSYLYNIHGSEGDRNSRMYIDNLIVKNGFWTASRIIIANAT